MNRKLRTIWVNECRYCNTPYKYYGPVHKTKRGAKQVPRFEGVTMELVEFREVPKKKK